MLSSLLDILLPETCPLCYGALAYTRQKPKPPVNNTGGLCADCFIDFKRITSPICTLCGAPFVTAAAGDHLCSACIKAARVPYVKARSALYYTGSSAKSIKLFKYHGLFALKPAFAVLLSPVLHEFTDTDLIIPVPLHRKRLRHRGFNQSLILARIVAKQLKKELDYTALKRTKFTKPQTGLKEEERRRNVRGAFTIKRGIKYKGKRVLLVDDVYTTGATITECARILKRAGAKVSVLTLARTARV